MKYLFYGILLMVLYRLFFKQTIVVEHRHFYDEKSDKKRIQGNKKKGDDYVEYEEVK
ncbi:MAG: hypothetical protein RL757_1677 [Bacteroidota bacterium]